MDSDAVLRSLENASLPDICWELFRESLKPTGHNGTDYVDYVDRCADSIPTSAELFKDMPSSGYILIGFLTFATCLTLANYIEEIHFVMTRFRKETRKRKTIWILAFFPVFSMTGLLGVLVPRSGTLVDMTANVFFGTCLYNFGRLMVDYMGGPRRMWELIEDRDMALNTPPCCCCCVCLPKIKFRRYSTPWLIALFYATGIILFVPVSGLLSDSVVLSQWLIREIFFRITLQIMQVAIVRPILMFFAAVLWANGSYHPGNMSIYNGYLYVTVLNLVSTVIAVYGLMLTRGALRPELEQQFSITGKIASLQLTLLSSAIPNLIISILVSLDVIECSPLFPSKARGEMLYHSFLVLMMLPFSLLGRLFYRRESDGHGFAKAPGPSASKVSDELATITHHPNSKVSQEMTSFDEGARVVNSSFPEDLDSESKLSLS